MIRLLPTLFQIPLLTALVLSTAQAAGPKIPPAPYRPVAAGTVLDYGSWKCFVGRGAAFEHVCRNPKGQVATFFGKFVSVGSLTESGYGTGLDEIWCPGFTSNNVERIALDEVLLDDAARNAIRSLWPLQVGKEISFQRNFGIEIGKAKSKIKVAGTKAFTIAGVEQRVFVVEGRTDEIWCPHNDTLGFREVWWFDPKLAAVIHYEMKWIDSPTTGIDFDYSLVRATMPRPAAKTKIAKAVRPPIAQLPDTPPPPTPRPVPTARPGKTPEPKPTKKAVRAPVRPKPPPAFIQDKTPPEITVARRLTASGKTVEVIGSVRDASQIAEVTIDGRRIAVSADGKFRVRRVVPPGKSVLLISALDEWGNEAARKITVTRPRAVAARPQMRREVKPDPFAGLDFGAYHAVVIGNNAYRNFPDLKSAVHDAEAVAALLREEYGFKVNLLRNASREDLIGILAKKRQELTDQDNLLIYFAGHGVLDKETNEGYWLPVEAKRDNPANWVSNADITTMLRAIAAKHIMVVADSCYSGTLVRGISLGNRPAGRRPERIRRLLAQRSRIALVSGGLEPVVDGSGGGHSVFARAFMNALKSNRSVLEGNRLFDAIRRPVRLNANQTPRYSDIRLAGHEGGDFVFVRR